MSNRVFLVGGLKVAQSIVKNPVFAYREDGGKVFNPATDYSLGNRNHLIWDYDFEGGWNARQRIGDRSDITETAVEWMQSQMQTAGAGTTVDDPAGSGTKVMRHHWRKSAVPTPATNVSKKSYLWAYKDDNSTRERWYGFSLYFPTDGFNTDSRGCIVTQWHGHPDSGEPFRNPPLSLGTDDGILRCARIYDERELTPKDSSERGYEEGNRRTTVELGPALLDVWQHFVVHVVWSPTTASGTLELWLNGTKLIDEVGNCQIGYNDDIGTCYGTGIYMWDQARSDHDYRTFYTGDVYIGNENATYADVYTGP